LGPTQAQIYFIHADHLNTPRLVADAAGTTVWRWDQAEPFGNNPADENPSGLGVFDLPLRLPGQRYDAETGLHYNYFRDYDPSLGRYSQSDPVGLMFGPNTYLYGLANPLSNTDFTGLFSSDSFGIAEGGGFGIGGALTVHKQSGIGVGGSAGLEIRSCCGPDNLVYTEYLLVANLGPSWGQSRRLSPTGNINAVRVGPMPKCVSETKFEAGLLSVNVQVFGAVVGTDLQTLTGTIGITAGSGASLVVNMLSGTRPLWKTPTGERCDCNKAE
jgi:RHS repeat-associated protein